MTELIYQLLQGKTKDALVFNVITILLYMDSYLQKKKKNRVRVISKIGLITIYNFIRSFVEWLEGIMEVYDFLTKL